MKKSKLILCSILFVALASSALVFGQKNTNLKRSSRKPPRQVSFVDEKIELQEKVSEHVGSKEAPLLFTIGVHIEPVGKRAKDKRNRSSKRGTKNYETNKFLFNRDLKNIQTLAGIVEKQGGKIVVQSQTPFTNALISSKSSLFKSLESKGHEIGLHFHENVQINNSDSQPVETWTTKMKEEIALLKKAGATKVNYWSGGNLYPGLLKAASSAGLSVMSDYKNRNTQQSDKLLNTVNPWRPQAGPKEGDMAGFAKHDSGAPIVYLPDGMFPDTSASANIRAKKQGGSSAYFDYLTKALVLSLQNAKSDKVNVFHITVHPGEFHGSPKTDKPFEVIDKWLTQIVSPLVQQGKVKWATFSEMAKTYQSWEAKNPGVSPRAAVVAVASQEKEVEKRTFHKNKGYISFIINVHDIKHVDESANTLIRLVKLFQKHGVKGDFYLTAPMVHLYQEKRPDIIALLKNTHMTISYHARPPHPINRGFDGRLKNLSDEELKKTLLDYETYRLDMRTGELNKKEVGGYKYVKEVFGRAPVVAGSPAKDSRIKKAHLKVLKELGAKMTILYHESGTNLHNPYQYIESLLVRPSDFSVTRWRMKDTPQKAFWWNMLDKPFKDQYNPLTYFKKMVAEWTGSRPPFVTAIIHENNFFRRLATPWAYMYYHDRQKQQPKKPPYDIYARDASQSRTEANTEAIYKAYEELIEYTTKYYNVVTSEGIVKMAVSE